MNGILLRCQSSAFFVFGEGISVIFDLFATLKETPKDCETVRKMKKVGFLLANSPGTGRTKWDGFFFRVKETAEKVQRCIQRKKLEDIPLCFEFPGLSTLSDSTSSNRDRICACLWVASKLNPQKHSTARDIIPDRLVLQVYNAVFQKGWANTEIPLNADPSSAPPPAQSTMDIFSSFSNFSTINFPPSELVAPPVTHPIDRTALERQEKIELLQELKTYSDRINCAQSFAKSNPGVMDSTSDIGSFMRSNMSSMKHLPALAKRLAIGVLSSAESERRCKSLKRWLKISQQLGIQRIAAKERVRIASTANYWGKNRDAFDEGTRRRKVGRVSVRGTICIDLPI